MNTLKQLKALYVKLGGKLTDTYSDIADGAPVSAYTKNAEGVAALSKVASGGGGGGLPEDFPAEDLSNANKFVGFDENGDYTAKDETKEIFWVNYFLNEGEPAVDKSFNEISSAIEAGKIPVLKFESDKAVYCLNLIKKTSSRFIFSGSIDGECSAMEVYNGEPAVNIYGNYSFVPQYSGYDNGKFLGVDDGGIEWVGNPIFKVN